MGFVDQQMCAVVGTQVGHAFQVGTGAFHAEQAFGHDQRCCRCVLQPLQTLVEILKIVVGKSLQPCPTRADACQQRVVNQPVHQHGGVPFTQGCYGGDIGLKSTGEQQHPIPIQPGGEGRLQLQMTWSGACDESRATGPDPIGGHGFRCCCKNGGMAAEAEVVIAGQIKQLARAGGIPQLPGLPAGVPAPQATAARRVNGRSLVPHHNSLEPALIKDGRSPLIVMTWERFTLLFPLWTLLGAVLALVHPPLFVWFRGPLIALGLGVIMLGMGVGLTPADFLRVGRRPRAMLLGVLAQFLVMPALAAAIAAALHLPAPLAVGLILVGCCPGGTASNVVALIGRGDVALSVVMTTISTLAAVVLTPRLTQVLASQYVPVDGWALFLTVLQVVLLPVTVGVVLKRGLPGVAQRIEPVMPPLAVMSIVMIVSSIVGSQTAVLRQQGPVLILACLLLHGGGFLLGWLIPRLMGQTVQAQRTVSIEVGMQNSGLAVVLARSGGFASPLTALPGAISAVIHCLIGSALAALWRRRPTPSLRQSS